MANLAALQPRSARGCADSGNLFTVSLIQTFHVLVRRSRVGGRLDVGQATGPQRDMERFERHICRSPGQLHSVSKWQDNREALLLTTCRFLSVDGMRRRIYSLRTRTMLKKILIPWFGPAAMLPPSGLAQETPTGKRYERRRDHRVSLPTGYQFAILVRGTWPMCRRPIGTLCGPVITLCAAVTQRGGGVHVLDSTETLLAEAPSGWHFPLMSARTTEDTYFGIGKHLVYRPTIPQVEVINCGPLPPAIASVDDRLCNP
jgi:hypothetical protein